MLSGKSLMPKTVIDCGNCGPDHVAIKRLIEGHFDANVVQTDGAEDTLACATRQSVDLICVNRKLDCDYSDGMEVIRQLRANPATAEIPVMLITNYEEHQQEAMQAGAVRGFGKLSLADPATRDLLTPFLSVTDNVS